MCYLPVMFTVDGYLFLGGFLGINLFNLACFYIFMLFFDGLPCGYNDGSLVFVSMIAIARRLISAAKGYSSDTLSFYPK